MKILNSDDFWDVCCTCEHCIDQDDLDEAFCSAFKMPLDPDVLAELDSCNKYEEI